MAIELFDSENGDYDITSAITVLTHTPDTKRHTLAQGFIVLGDGTKDLDGVGGNFELTVTIGGQTYQANPEVIVFGTEARSCILTPVFTVPSGNEVIIKVKSPNGADTDVDVTAYLFQR
jgi:hypothetical protein